ncbi:MAG: hypothetical protein WEA81_05695 [Dehalococcoidia bacterium]
MRLSEYYSQVVRDGRSGRPSIHEARADYRRNLGRQYDVHRIR